MNKNIKKINTIRAISCIAVLLYHIGLLKGGYLAVCTFFVLTGYLAIISNYNNQFNIKSYYYKRFKKVYLPLLIVIFVTLGIISIIPNVTYLNYKREIYSILLGYNNYWQLNAQLDYFTRFVSSPFMHLWYIAIILQFDLVFPIILIGIKKISNKISKILPFLLLFIISIISYILFYQTTKTGSLMSAYYGTITRLFSITLGMMIGLLHVRYKPVIVKNKVISNIIFYTYLFIVIIFFLLFSFKSKNYSIYMLLITFISLRLIDYSIVDNSNKTSIDNIIEKISKISYEIYLVQYPIIFIFQSWKSWFKYPIIIILTYLISYLLNYIFNKKKDNKIRIILIILVSLISIFGLFKFVIAKDNTKEMKKLENDLKNNQLIIEKRQKEFEKRKKEEDKEWKNTLNDLESNEKDLENKVRNMTIVGIGDSIMELAINDLIKEFPNGYFDAKTNRRPSQVNDLLIELKNKGILGDVVLFNVGTNGEFYPRYTDQIMETLENRKVFWVNATNADYDDFNDRLNTLAAKYSNITIIDWVSVANEHPEYLIYDKVHPTVYGCKIYASTLYNAIYNEILKEYREQKELKIKEHEKQEQEKITFIGNDLLIGLYEQLENNYQNSLFIMDKKLDYNSIKKEMKENNISNNIVFLFNKKSNLTSEDYNKLLEDYKNNNILIIDLYNTINIEKENIKVIDVKKELNKDSFAIDGIHLNDKGNKIVKKILDNNLKKD